MLTNGTLLEHLTTLLVTMLVLTVPLCWLSSDYEFCLTSSCFDY